MYRFSCEYNFCFSGTNAKSRIWGAYGSCTFRSARKGLAVFQRGCTTVSLPSVICQWSVFLRPPQHLGVVIFVLVTWLSCVAIGHRGFNLHFSHGDARDVEHLFVWYLPPVSSSGRCWLVMFNHQCSLCAFGGSSD